MKRAGSLLHEVFDLAEKHIYPGNTSLEVDKVVGGFLNRHKAVSTSRLRGHPFDINISINTEVIQGVPSGRKFEVGDLVTIDLAIFLEGVCVDKAKTITLDPSGYEKRYLVTSVYKCMEAAKEGLYPGVKTSEIGNLIKDAARSQRVTVGYEFYGHGIGFDHHMLPLIPNYDDGSEDIIGEYTYFTIEPVIFYGNDYKLFVGKDFVVTSNLLSAQAEDTVVLTPNGIEVLT